MCHGNWLKTLFFTLRKKQTFMDKKIISLKFKSALKICKNKQDFWGFVPFPLSAGRALAKVSNNTNITEHFLKLMMSSKAKSPPFSLTPILLMLSYIKKQIHQGENSNNIPS